MTSCREIDANPTAYVDGEASPDQRRAVETHFRACPTCRGHADIERSMREVMRSRGSALAEPASETLRARCVAAVPDTVLGGREASRAAGAGPPRTGRGAPAWAPLSIAATVLLAVAAAFGASQHERLSTAFAAQLAKDHERCFADAVDLVADFGRDQAEARVRELGVDVAMPAESASFDVLDVRGCLYDEGQMAHVLCTWEGQPVSLFVVPGRSARDGEIEIVGHDAVIWSRGDLRFVLVAEHGPVEIDRVAAYVRASLP